jgi:RNA recognition motif-containing protein
MGKKLYVGNLPYSVDDAGLAALFAQAGTVENANIARDMTTGRARGFGFVEMATDDEARRAIEQLNNSQIEGRTLVVNEARSRVDRGGFDRGRGRGGARRHDGGGRGAHGSRR